MTKNLWKVSVLADQSVHIDTEYIKLDSLLKLAGAVMTGGEAKHAIQMSFVRVNGNICVERGKKLRPGDVVLFAGITYVVE